MQFVRKALKVDTVHRMVRRVLTALRATSTRTRLLAAALLVAVVVVVGLAQSEPASKTPRGTPPSAVAVQSAAARAPAPLRRLYRQHGQLLHLNGDAFVAKMKALEGHVVLINKWASWCAPCRREFTLLRRAAARYGDRVAFLGLNAADKAQNARRFLKTNPTIYPHVQDPDEQIAGAFQAGGVFPQTILVDATGDVTAIKAGEFATDRQVDQFLRPHLTRNR